MARLRRRWAPPLVGLLLSARGAVAVRDDVDPLAADYSHLTWIDAFEALNIRMARFYPFGDSKKIDWQDLARRFAPRVLRAESTGNVSEYYAALREYAYSLHDGHIAVSGESDAMVAPLYTAVSESFGLRVVELDNGRVLVSDIVAGGPAAQAGLEVGAEILGWNGLPIQEAIELVSVIWADVPPSRRQTRRLEQLALLTRAPRGESVVVTFTSPSNTSRRAATTTQTVVLTARDDDILMEDLSPFPSDDERAHPIDYSILDGKVGYLRITTFDFDVAAAEQQFLETFRDAIMLFTSNRVAGVIIDVRRNDGGLNRLIVKVAGFFSRRRRHFETVTSYNPDNGRFEVDTDDPESHLDILPQHPFYAGPVVTLVGPGTMSAAEGLARALQSRPHSLIAGIYGSHGTYGICSAEVRLPEGLTFDYPYGRSLDVRGRLQLNANANGQGGVRLDVRVPLNEQTFGSKYIEGRDIELEQAIIEIRRSQRGPAR